MDGRKNKLTEPQQILV